MIICGEGRKNNMNCVSCKWSRIRKEQGRGDEEKPNDENKKERKSRKTRKMIKRIKEGGNNRNKKKRK